MTEPREPEANLDEGESTRPIEQRPEAASWYPAAPAAPSEEAEPAAAQDVSEPAVEEQAAGAPSAGAPIEDEPAGEPHVMERAAEAPVGNEPTAEAPVENEPTAEAPVEYQPAAEAPVAEDAVVAEPEVQPPVDEAPSAPVESGSAAAGHGDQATDDQTHTLLGEAEPTVVTDVPAEETVALHNEPVNESTSVLPNNNPAEPVPPAAGPIESIFRQPSPASGPEFEPTRVEQLSDEEQKLAAERGARREARATALAAAAPVPQVAPEPVIVHKRTNDKFWGSVGLFLLRLVLAAILAVRGLNLLTDIPAAQAMFAKTLIPYPGIMAIVTGIAALLIALSLILGLFTRLAGLGIALIGGGALAFVYWGSWSPFVAGRPGFLGDYELLLTAVGVLLLCIGAGGWSLDHSIRAGRERNKAERVAADLG